MSINNIKETRVIGCLSFFYDCELNQAKIFFQFIALSVTKKYSTWLRGFLNDVFFPDIPDKLPV
jgi:hypothetical protein